MKPNVILSADSYKYSHHLQDPKGITSKYAYISARKDNSGLNLPGTIFFGIQFLLESGILNPVTKADINEAEVLVKAHGLPFNREGWDYIVNDLQGRLPIRIKAAPEGTLVPFGLPSVTVESTDPKCWWLPTFLETLILKAVWYPTTVASLSWSVKRDLLAYSLKSCDDLSGLDFKLHDFGYRGVSSEESARIGGAAHLVNFKGTDTLAAVRAVMETYKETDIPAFSIPASEHSTITTWGHSLGDEEQAYENMITQFGGSGNVFAVVSDSFDLETAINELWLGKLKNQVSNNGGTLVVRPDSGDPVTTPVNTILKLMGGNRLGGLSGYGYTVNSKGYKVLPSCIRVIQGDGITPKTIREILALMDENRLSLDNLTFGMGGGLLQSVNRDTFGFAMKASSATISGEEVDVFKEPKTDPSKASLKGRVTLVRSDTYEALDLGRNECLPPGFTEVLETVFENGEVLRMHSFEEIRQRANKELRL